MSRTLDTLRKAFDYRTGVVWAVAMLATAVVFVLVQADADRDKLISDAVSRGEQIEELRDEIEDNRRNAQGERAAQAERIELLIASLEAEGLPIPPEVPPPG